MPERLERFVDVVAAVASVAALIILTSIVWGRVGPDGNNVVHEPVAEWQAIAGEGHSTGPVDAGVTIVEWGDYECGACRRWASHVKHVYELYPDHVRFVYRTLSVGVT